MKILIIGGVAAGTKVAAKLKRENRSDQVTIITKEKNISYEKHNNFNKFSIEVNSKRIDKCC